MKAKLVRRAACHVMAGLRWRGLGLGSDSCTTMSVPEGCAHGLVTLEPDSDVPYLISTRFACESATGIRDDDPAIGSRWPVATEVISRRDADWPLLDEDYVGAWLCRPGTLWVLSTTFGTVTSEDFGDAPTGRSAKGPSGHRPMRMRL